VSLSSDFGVLNNESGFFLPPPSYSLHVRGCQCSITYLDTAICNAYILSEHYRKSQSAKKVRGTHRAFREALIKELLVQYKIQPTRKYLTGRHLQIRPPRVSSRKDNNIILESSKNIRQVYLYKMLYFIPFFRSFTVVFL
jgi:hypothetical protein